MISRNLQYIIHRHIFYDKILKSCTERTQHLQVKIKRNFFKKSHCRGHS